MKQPYVSIIIPIYNVGGYLANTLQSVIAQTSTDFELIVINDGSTDNSLKLAEDILKKTAINYKIFSHSNKGVGYTRNIGIKNAKGKYIYFLDGDDTIEKNMIESLTDLMKNNFDIILFKYKYKNNVSIMNEQNIEKTLCGKEIIKLFCISKVNINMCSFIVKKSLLEKNQILFHEQAKYGEDHEFILKILFHSNKGIMVQDILFNYIHRESSAVNTFSHHRLDSLESAKRLISYIESKDTTQVLLVYMRLYLLGKCRDNLISMSLYNTSDDLKQQVLNQVRISSKKYLKLELIQELSLFRNFVNFIKIILIRNLTYSFYRYLLIRKHIKVYLKY